PVLAEPRHALCRVPDAPLSASADGVPIRPDLALDECRLHRAGLRQHVSQQRPEAYRHHGSEARDRGLQHDLRGAAQRARTHRLYAEGPLLVGGSIHAERLSQAGSAVVSGLLADGSPPWRLAEPVLAFAWSASRRTADHFGAGAGPAADAGALSGR